MKNKSILWLLSAAYTFLLYHQGAGINILLLNLFLLAVLFWQYKQELFSKHNRLFVFGVLYSSVFVCIHGHFLAVLANILSLAFLTINIGLKKSSVAGLFLHSLYAGIITLPKRWFKRFTYSEENKTEEELAEAKPTVNKLIIAIVSFLVFALFITFYRFTSANFNQFVLNLNLDFISLPLVIYYLFASMLMAIFLKPAILEKLAANELVQTEKLNYSIFKPYTLFGSNMLEITEDTLAKILFWGLNLMLLLVNVLDTEFMVSGKLPEGVNYSEYLHQGITSLILSILSAIAIILWFFRGSQNFKENKSITYLAYLWIILNGWLVVSAAYRNHLYIADHSLFTYKRIGVYVFLFCASAGLVLTFLKLRYQYSNYYLIKSNSLLWFVVLILSVSINWDRFIAQNHLQAARERNEIPDINYLSSLSYQAYPVTINYLSLQLQKNKGELEYDPYYYFANTEMLLSNMILAEENYNWKSYNYARCKAYREINQSIRDLDNQMVQTEYKNAFARFNEYRNPFNF